MTAGDEQEPVEPGAAILAALVPKHYTINATLTDAGMYRLTIGIRRLCDEYDAGPECEQLLAQCLEAFAGDLPVEVTTPIDEEGEDAPIPAAESADESA